MWDCNLNQFEGCPPCSLAPHFPFHSLVHRPAVSALSLSRALRYFSTLGDLNGLTCRSLEQARRSRATTVKTCQTAWERNQPRRRAIIWHKVPAQIKVASSLLGLAEPSRQHPHPSPIPQQATHSKLHLVVLAFALYELMCSWTMLPFSTWNKQNRTVPFFLLVQHSDIEYEPRDKTSAKYVADMWLYIQAMSTMGWLLQWCKTTSLVESSSPNMLSPDQCFPCPLVPPWAFLHLSLH